MRHATGPNHALDLYRICMPMFGARGSSIPYTVSTLSLIACASSMHLTHHSSLYLQHLLQHYQYSPDESTPQRVPRHTRQKRPSRPCNLKQSLRGSIRLPNATYHIQISSRMSQQNLKQYIRHFHSQQCTETVHLLCHVKAIIHLVDSIPQLFL